MRDELARGRLLATLLLCGWAASLVATALSRPLDPEVLFYASRYFAAFAALPAIVLSLGLARLRPLLGGLLLAREAVRSYDGGARPDWCTELGAAVVGR